MNAVQFTIKRLIRTLKRYRTFTITLNGQTLHAANTPPTHITELLNHINQHIYERKI